MAADPSIVSAATSSALIIKDNLVGSITSSIPFILGAGLLVFSISFVWQLVGDVLGWPTGTAHDDFTGRDYDI